MNDNELKKQQKLELRAQQKENYIKVKTLQKKEHGELKVYIKEQKQRIKNLSIEHKKSIAEHKKNNSASTEELVGINNQYHTSIIDIKNEIIQRKFDFGAKFKTYSWQCLKWTNGIRKEFNRIIWSNPTNTFKYLGIIVLVILILAALFFGIDNIITAIKPA